MTYSAGNTIVDDDYNIFATGNAAGTGDKDEERSSITSGSGIANSVLVSWFSGYTTPCRMTGVTLHSHVCYTEI